MIEEPEDRLAIGTEVEVSVFPNEKGYIYERGIDDGHTVYGVRFPHSVFPRNFIPTTVWHCEREALSSIKSK